MEERKKHFPGVAGTIPLLLLVLVLSVLIPYSLSFLSVRLEQKILMGITNSFAFGIAILIGFKLSKRKASEVFRMDPPRPLESLSFILTAIGLSILLSEADNLFSLVYPKPRWIIDAFGGLFDGENMLQSFLLLSVVAPVTEELFFRGLLLDGFLRNYSVKTAFLLSALLFGAIHLNPWQFVSATMIGVYLAWILYHTNSIFQTILVHAVFNGIPLLVLHVLKLEIVGYTTISEFGRPQSLQPAWLDLLGLLITGFGLFSTLIFFRKRKSERSAEISYAD
ncbi:CPBP family intramembrane metalloprotease [Leptospira langatensis]|uniref:CPBP family intramembrane metalloprotease n=1 Tax=Leptospira langatensis TaxID=2484983 RepID=A0A5F1ZRT9_9LEPT|nr:CPBP family intramembrane glutamic endopeptidase [Leptospira langatensis]TGK02577.1 CPBP family intramembrane metalloprotease [Leptospira langatensis]TGL40223.1 CPBP family intramembrane metalloprotease [Leptospira langatensis]